jgi:hypothetical protein
MSVKPVVLDAEAHAEIVSRLVNVRDAVAKLAVAYDDPVASRGAEEMTVSLDRVLELLGCRPQS